MSADQNAWMDRPNTHKAYHKGRQAFLAGCSTKTCPYTSGHAVAAWFLGYEVAEKGGFSDKWDPDYLKAVQRISGHWESA